MTISTATFQYVSELIRRETAMLYEPGKEYLVEARLLPLAREVGAPTIDAYVEQLRTDAGARRKAIDALTINETSWFRDDEPYKAFTTEILPALLEARKGTRRLSIWSAACSSGQEAYSLAMLLAEHLPSGWTAEILATDVSTAMIERVRSGLYGQVEMNRGLPPPMLFKHFTRIGSDWEVSGELRRMVRVRHLNLAAPFPQLPTFDLVLLRNVLIYFDMAVKRDVLQRVRQVTAPDGYLMLGSAETTLGLDDHWTRESIGRITGHRPAAPAPTARATSALTALTGVFR